LVVPVQQRQLQNSRYLMGSLKATIPTDSRSNLEQFLFDRLLDQSQPIHERFRALFSLRNLKGPGPRNALIHGSSLFLLFFFINFTCVSDFVA
jgi:hypothetical protein